MHALAVHERWFVSSEGLPTQWGELLAPPTLVAIAVAGGVTALAVLLWKRRDGRPVVPGPFALGATTERMAVVMGWVPLILGLHTAVPLFVSGVQNQLFVPNLQLALPGGAIIGLAEVGIGLLLFYGLFARFAALGLAALWLLGVVIYGPVLLLEQVIFLGIAAFFFISGRGPISTDRIFGARAGPREDLLPRIVPILRIAAGAGIAWLAFTEKLINVPLALSFMEEYPFVNFLPALGIPVSDVLFVRLAGTAELLLGLLLITGVFPRLVILGVWLPFNFTLTAFGWQELVGHLPIYATMALVLLWGTGDERDIEALRKGLSPGTERFTAGGAEAERGREAGVEPSPG